MAKMDVFISWSGPRSRAVAEALKKYLPMIVNDLNPWLSSADIDKGSRSTDEIAAALANARAGIICLTPNNLKEPWILFEAGAIAKTVRQKPLACTLLLGLEITDVSGPLAQFQATKPERQDLLELIKDLNKALRESRVDERQIDETFDLCWPKLKAILDNLPPDGSEKRPARSSEDMLKEIVAISRGTSANVEEMHAQLGTRLSALERSVAESRFTTASPLFHVFDSTNVGIVDPSIPAVVQPGANVARNRAFYGEVTEPVYSGFVPNTISAKEAVGAHELLVKKSQPDAASNQTKTNRKNSEVRKDTEK